MFPSQASYVFNPLLPFTPTVSIPLLSFDGLTPFPGAPILQKTAEFISASYSSSSNIFKSTATTTPLPHDPEGDLRSPYESLEDAVRRLIGDYRQLSTIIEDKQARYGDEQARNLCFPQKVRTLAMINQFKSHILNLLYRLAVLTVEYSQEYPLLRNAHRICTALTDSPSFRSSLEGHKSTTIYKLLNMISNVPLMIENSVFQDYSKDTYTKTEDNEEEAAARMLSLACTAGQDTSSSLIDMLMLKKSISCSDGDAEEESERHERSSTTSASSRTNHGEVDVQITYNVFGSSPESQKTASATKEIDVNEQLVNLHEIYDGCFFGDLTVTFSRSDKILFEDDEIPVIESNGHHHTWRKNNHYYNNNYNRNNMKPNFPMPPMFNNANQNNNNNYPGFNQRFEEPNWKTNPIQTINPSLLKTPPTQQDQKIIPLNLFTLPQGTFIPPANTFAPFNPANLIPQAPVQQQQQINTPPPFNNRRVPANQEFKGIQPMKAMSEQKPRDVSRESQSSLLSDRQQQHQQQQPQKVSSTNNKQSNSATAPKNSQIQADKNVNAGKKGKPQNAKKKQDKGGIKLWDMISVQGKLKNF